MRLALRLGGLRALLLVAGLGLAAAAGAKPAAAIAPEVADLSTARCQSCHDGSKTIEVADGTKKRKLGSVPPTGYAKGVHAKLGCVECHREIVDATTSHQKTATAKPDCAGCHEALAAEAKQAGRLAPGLDKVGKNIAAYRASFHARKNADDPTRPNATCAECHGTHDFRVPAPGTAARLEWQQGIPALCGDKCHEDHVDDFKKSVHGTELLSKNNPESASCVDCHTSHAIGNTSTDPIKLAITKDCGNCHADRYRTYRNTYHGQVFALGYAYTAKCFDCHGSHAIQKSDHAKARQHPDNLLKACRKCHDGKAMPEATAGFVSFGAHAHANDRERYPQMWYATRFMVALLIGVFAFFWTHSGLWYYREWMDRRQARPRPYVRTAGLGIDETKHVQRFAAGWRVGHLAFALVTMTLVLSGTSVMYAESAWAPVVAKLFGGPARLALIHRVAAALFIGIFLIHFVYVAYKLLVVRRREFRWFGPDSLLPRWQDFRDCIAMFKWFVGRGPRPAFDRWAYFEKFDYWAVFWGVSVIGSSGLMLAFPHVTASLLPGWVFNVATLVHGEEAFLAAVFLFTVHFFNNHFRPDKLPPPDIVMFTGTLSLEEFRRDHPAQYNRLVETGELAKHLVDAPSPPMRRGSRILGLVLIACGLVLLVLVLNGFLGSLAKA